MLALVAVDTKAVMTSLPEKESISYPRNPSKEPSTPELQQQEYLQHSGRFSIPTPDTTPNRRVAPVGRSSSSSSSRQVHPAYPCDPLDVGPATPPLSSRAPSIADVIDREDYRSQHSVNSEGSEESLDRQSSPLPSPPSQSAPRPGRETNYRFSSSSSSSFTFRSAYGSIIRLSNLARQRRSRADDARVHSTIDLIKSIHTIRRTRTGNLTRKLTPKQYGELLRVIAEDEDDAFRSWFNDKFRYDYTRRNNRLEIRMPTNVHEQVGGFILKKILQWSLGLEKSPDARVADAARAIMASGSTDVKFDVPRGESDSKSPDNSIGHEECERNCEWPTMLMEIAFSHGKDVRDTAKTYSDCRTKGEVRTVVVVDLQNLYAAEKKNERKLLQKYVAGEVDKADKYTYADDKNNITGSASLLVWQAKIGKNNRVSAICVQDEKFRDEEGNAIESVSLQLPLQYFTCQGILESPAGKFDVPPLEISAQELNHCINNSLRRYRRERDKAKKHDAEKEREKLLQKTTEKKSKREKVAKTVTSDATAEHEPQAPGILGRIKIHGKLVSARLR